MITITKHNEKIYHVKEAGSTCTNNGVPCSMVGTSLCNNMLCSQPSITFHIIDENDERIATAEVVPFNEYIRI